MLGISAISTGFFATLIRSDRTSINTKRSVDASAAFRTKLVPTASSKVGSTLMRAIDVGRSQSLQLPAAVTCCPLLTQFFLAIQLATRAEGGSRRLVEMNVVIGVFLI